MPFLSEVEQTAWLDTLDTTDPSLRVVGLWLAEQEDQHGIAPCLAIGALLRELAERELERDESAPVGKNLAHALA